MRNTSKQFILTLLKGPFVSALFSSALSPESTQGRGAGWVGGWPGSVSLPGAAGSDTCPALLGCGCFPSF